MIKVPVTSAAVDVPKLAYVTTAVTTEPAVALAGSATVVLTSANGAIVAVTVETLLVGVGSGVLLVIVAWLVVCSVWLVVLLTLTTKLIVVVPTLKLTAVAVIPVVLVTKLNEPLALLALINLMLPGNTSATVTVPAALGPALTMLST